MFDVVLRCTRLIGRGERRPWIVLIALSLVVSGLEVLAALAIFLLFAAISEKADSARIPLVGSLDDVLPGSSAHQRIVILCVGIAVFYAVRAALTIVHSYLQYRVAGVETVRLSVRLLQEYIARPFSWHQEVNSAILQRNVIASTDLVARMVFTPITIILAEGTLLLAMLAVLLLAAPVVTLVAAGSVGLVVLVLLRVIQPRVGALGAQAEVVTAEGIQAIAETLAGIREVKMHEDSAYFVEGFRALRLRAARARYVADWLQSIPRISVETLFVLFVVAFLLAKSGGGATASDSVPILGLFAYAVLRMLPSMNRIVLSITNLRFGVGGLDNIYDDLLQERARPRPTGETRTPIPFDRSLQLRDVWFRYASAPTWTLQAIDLSIRPGEFVGLVGSTGSGKTTLVDVLAGLLEPARGEVLVDGVDVAARLPAWHASMGMVPQTIFLADASIRRNIAFGLAEHDIDDALVALAVERAQLQEFVSQLPEGTGTLVGERGVRLSGGQRQRIAIARALYRDPAVLLFDEGTSALDNVTERQILGTLEALRGTRTIIVVAHRLSTVRSCDRLVLLRAGEIVGQGTYDELVDSNADFRRMAK